jgi:hypothetical protein
LNGGQSGQYGTKRKNEIGVRIEILERSDSEFRECRVFLLSTLMKIRL